MLKMFFVAGSVLTLLFGAVGVAAAAAQNSQPGEPLYALKAWGEPLQFLSQAREQTQTQAMNGSVSIASGQGLQTQEMLQAQQMNNPTGAALGQQDQDQVRLQIQDRLQTHQSLDQTVTLSGDQDRDQTQDQDQIQLQTQDRLHTQDCVPDPQGSAAQNQYGGSHKP